MAWKVPKCWRIPYVLTRWRMFLWKNNRPSWTSCGQTIPSLDLKTADSQNWMVPWPKTGSYFQPAKSNFAVYFFVFKPERCPIQIQQVWQPSRTVKCCWKHQLVKAGWLWTHPIFAPKQQNLGCFEIYCELWTQTWCFWLKSHGFRVLNTWN